VTTVADAVSYAAIANGAGWSRPIWWRVQVFAEKPGAQALPPLSAATKPGVMVVTAATATLLNIPALPPVGRQKPERRRHHPGRNHPGSAAWPAEQAELVIIALRGERNEGISGPTDSTCGSPM